MQKETSRVRLDALCGDSCLLERVIIWSNGLGNDRWKGLMSMQDCGYHSR